VEGCFSEWRSVASGVPHGSVLGPLLFVVYINDLEENVGDLISTFADDTEIGGVADSAEDCQRIQQHIDTLHTWEQKWQVELNPDKCEVMHFGGSNLGMNDTVSGRTLRNINIRGTWACKSTVP